MYHARRCTYMAVLTRNLGCAVSLRASQQSMLKITGVFAFSYKEMALATDDFSQSKEVQNSLKATLHCEMLLSLQTDYLR